MTDHNARPDSPTVHRAPLAARLSILSDLVARDFAHAARGLLRTPGFTVVALAILGIGIGANTAIYSVVHTALFSPSLPYRQADRTIRVYAEQTAESGGRRPGSRWLSYPEFVEISQQRDLFRQAAAASDGQVWSLQAMGQPPRSSVRCGRRRCSRSSTSFPSRAGCSCRRRTGPARRRW
jgi:hypothetical protein